MCLAIPMQITRIDGFAAVCEAKGVSRDVSLFILQDEQLTPGDHVLVHVGFALSRIDEEEARRVFSYLEEMGELGELEIPD